MHNQSKFQFNWLIKKIYNDYIRQYQVLMNGVIFDLGCGTRPYENDILLYADFYIGVDWSNTLHGLQADLVADLNQPLPIRNNVADAVVSFQVLEHLCEPQMMLNEAFRILRPEGRIFLSVPFQWWVHEAPWDYFRFTRYGLEHIFKKAGFVEIKVEAVSGFWSMWFLKLNYQTARLVRGPRPLRWLIRGALIPFWWLDQIIAPLLDRVWPAEGETAGYFVTARKP